MIGIGRLAIKIAGRDAGGTCVVVDILDNNYALIDGNVRRRKCNILHLEPTSKKIELKKGASHEEVKREFTKLKLPIWETKPKEKKEKPKKQRGKKKLQAEAAIDVKKKGKKETKKETKQDKEKPKAEKKEAKDKESKKKPIDSKIDSVTEKIESEKEGDNKQVGKK